MSYSKLTLTSLYSIVFLNAFGYFLIIPSLVGMMTDPSHSLISTHMAATWGNYLFSIVLGAGSLASLVSGPYLGRLSDQIGRRKVLIFCTLLTLASFILPMLAILTANFVLFILGNIINGISSNNQAIAKAVISDLSNKPSNKAWRLSIDTSVITIAMTLGPIAGSYLSDPQIVTWFNQTTPFLAASVLSLFSLILLIYLLPETNINAKTNGSFRGAMHWQTISDMLKLGLSCKRLLLVFFLVQLAWAQYYQYSYIYLSQVLHFTARGQALFNAWTGFCISISLLIIYPLWLRFFSLRTGISINIIMSFVGLLGLGMTDNPVLQWCYIVPLAFGIGLYFPSLLTLLSDCVTEQQGWIMTVASALLGLAWLISGFSSIYLSSIHSHLPTLSSALLVFVGMGIMWYDKSH